MRSDFCHWICHANVYLNFLKERVPSTTTVRELKELFEKKYPAFYPERQAFFLDKRSPAMPNNDCLATHGMTNECQLLFHDLGTGFKILTFMFPASIFRLWNTVYIPVECGNVRAINNWLNIKRKKKIYSKSFHILMRRESEFTMCLPPLTMSLHAMIFFFVEIKSRFAQF